MLVWFGPEGLKSASTEEVSPGIMLDFDSAHPLNSFANPAQQAS
jgi:hypothetical protein